MENLAVSENETNKAPETWLELPPHIWLQVMTYLGIKDINNIHLASRKFHEIASEFPHKVVMRDNFFEAVQTLTNFSRICDDVEVELFSKEDSAVICDFLLMTGAHVRKLILRYVRLTTAELMQILSSIPNVQSLELDSIKVIQETENLNDLLPLNIRKLKILTICNFESTVSVENSSSSKEFMVNFLDLLVCAPTEFRFEHYSGPKIEGFLQKHKKSIKKLELYNCEDQQPNLTGFKLEHLNLANELEHESPSIPISLLTEANSLKILRLGTNFATADNLNYIFHHLEGLESLELEIKGVITAECCHKLSQFKSLKRLAISDESLDDRKDDLVLGLTAVVNENLVDLKSTCGEFSSDDLCELSRCLPNLKKLEFGSCSFDHFCSRKRFENLEEYIVDYASPDDLFVMDINNIEPMDKLKALKISNLDHYLTKRDAKFLDRSFPALEKFSVFFCAHPYSDKAVMNILKNFSQLKTLQVNGSHDSEWVGGDDQEYQMLPLIRCLKKYRRNLESVHIYYAHYDICILRNVLKDLKGLRFSSNYFDIVI